MAKFDAERLIDSVRTFLTANLNTQISALNTEKNDGISLATVNSAAFVFQYPVGTTAFDPFVIVDEAEDPALEGTGPLVATFHRIGVTLILADSGADLNIARRLFRYRRVLLDLAQTYWDTIQPGERFELHAWSPSPPFPLSTGKNARAVGVIMHVVMTD